MNRRQLRKRKARPEETLADLCALTDAMSSRLEPLAALTASLRPRLHASHAAAAAHDEAIREAAASAGRGAVQELAPLGRLVSGGVKTLEAEVEGWIRTSEQLLAYAVALEGLAGGGGRKDAIEPAAAALIARTACPPASEPSLLRVCVDGGISRVAAEAARVRGATGHCAGGRVDGPGIVGFTPGAGNANRVRVTVLDECGEGVATAGPGDVAVRVEGGEVVGVEGPGGGVVEACYTVGEGVTGVRVHVCVLGRDVAGSPFPVGVSLFPQSELLPLVSAELRSAFSRELMSDWLPGQTAFQLLYRGSRDGMSPAAFHEKCDGMGPTFVLVRAVGEAGYTFGGFSGVDWQSNALGLHVPCDEAFLVSLVGPFNPGEVVFFPAKKGRHAIYQNSKCGPCFYSGFGVEQCFLDPDALGVRQLTFRSTCGLHRGSTYADVLGREARSFTGSWCAFLADIEVYAVL